VDPAVDWTLEHRLLGALARGAVASLAVHAARAGAAVPADARVARRDT